MYSEFTNSVAGASNCSTMEFRNHSKNGASPKSHTSRRNFLILAMFFLLNMNGFAQFSGGNGNQETPYLISSKTDMETLASNVNGGNTFAGKYFLLTQDLRLFNTVTTVIGTTSTRTFNGIFDGGGHEIEMSLNTTGDVGVFGYINKATIQNLTVNGSISTSSGSYASGICAYASNSSSIMNCHNKASLSVSTSAKISYPVGGICGYAASSTIADSDNTGNVSLTASYLGSTSFSYYVSGICGYATTSSITNSYNTGSVSLISSYSDFSYASYSPRNNVGGIVGSTDGSFTINDCYNTGKISATVATNCYGYTRSGGIVGYTNSGLTIKNCYNTGNVSSAARFEAHAGGITGYAIGTLTATNCYNTGSLSSSSLYSNSYCGGICGYAIGNLSNCYNSGYISSSNTPYASAGGICAYASNMKIENCFAANAEIKTSATTTTDAGRILGNGTSTTIANCYALSSMTINSNPVYSENTAIEKNGQDMDMASFQSQTWITNYLGWNFSTIWKQRPNEFPILFYQNIPTVAITFSIGTTVYGEQKTLNAVSENAVTPIVYESSDNTVAEITGNTLTAKKAGSALITARQAAGEGYPSGEASVNLSIQKRPLNVTPNNEIREYGDPNPAFSVSFSGFINGDNETAISPFPTATSSATANSPVGNYNIICSGGSAANYSFNYQNGTLTITQAPLTITAEDKTREQGQENPKFTLVYDGFKNSETAIVLDVLPTILCEADVDSPVGFYDIVLSGGSDNNYQYTLVNGRLEVTDESGIENIVANKMSIYPNPVKDEIFIQSELQIKKVEIYDISGCHVETLHLTSLPQNEAQTINVSALPRGIYMVKVSVNDDFVVSKLVKE